MVKHVANRRQPQAHEDNCVVEKLCFRASQVFLRVFHKSKLNLLEV